jgi:hypothetical protein
MRSIDGEMNGALTLKIDNKQLCEGLFEVGQRLKTNKEKSILDLRM